MFNVCQFPSQLCFGLNFGYRRRFSKISCFCLGFIFLFAQTQGLEVRRENPFPTSSERGAIEAASASQQALLAGKRGLLIDIEVKQRHSKTQTNSDPETFYNSSITSALMCPATVPPYLCFAVWYPHGLSTLRSSQAGLF